MKHLKLLPIPFLLTSINNVGYAEEMSLPAISVQSVILEVAPYAIPALPTSTTDLGDMVKRLPGVNINRNGVNTSVAQYRGLFGNRVNVLIDGVNVKEAGPNSMDAPLSYLAASRTKAVSVYRGIAPVRTGIETIGGTITAESSSVDFGQSDEAEVHGIANAGYTSNGQTRQLGLTSAITNQHHRLQISGSSDRGNDLDFNGGTIRSSKQDRDTVGLNYGYQNNGQTFDAGVEHIDIGPSGTAALPQDIVLLRGENFRTKYSNTLSNGDYYTLRMNYQDIDHVMNNFSQRLNTNLARHRSVNTDVIAGGLSAHYQHQNWLVGVDIDQAEHNATIYNPNNSAFLIENFNDIERDRYSLFSEWNGQVSTGWNLETGLRYSLVAMDAGDAAVFSGAPAGLRQLNTNFNNEKRSKDEHLIDVFALLRHDLSHQASVEIGLARKTRAPSYQERYLWAPLQSTGGLADGNNYVGDINLDHEVSYQFELGLDWHAERVAISPRLFYHHINDYIQGIAGQTSTLQNMVAASLNPGQPVPLKFSNVDAKLYGMDTNWLVAISSEWQLDGTVSYVRGERRDTSDDLYRIAPLTARTMLSYVQSTWRVGIEAETVAKQNNVSDENFEIDTSGYALFNLSGQYQASSDILVTAGVNNLFDRYYTDHLGGFNRANGNPDILVGDRLPGVGRNGYINLSYNF
ncbi:MAG: iron complex outermembrane receptor protein [Methylophagaceae bacterium]